MKEVGGDFMTQLPDMDSKLFYAVKCALGRLPVVAYDLKKIKVLDQFGGDVNPYYENVAAQVIEGDFSAISIMENLHTLSFFHGRGARQIQVDNFSFLPQCKRLKKLDLRDTNFTDCSLLLQLPALIYVQLPERSQLIHLEALDALPSKTKVEILPPQEPVAQATLLEKKIPAGSEQVKAIIGEIKTRTAANSYVLTIQPEKQPGIFDSKFGGLPYWDLTSPYPVGGDGKKLVLLAQINFNQFPVEEPLPQSGLLQFFVGQDDFFGADWDRLDQQINFRVVYHKIIDRTVTPEQIQALDIPTHADLQYWPVLQEVAVQMEKAAAYMGPDDGRFEEIFRQVVKMTAGEDIGEQRSYQYLNEEDYEYLYDQLSNSGHRLLGYPYFTQEDPRPTDCLYDTLLFQMDSEIAGGVDYTMWGDMGVGNFFINMEDLKKCDFSRVLYTWDCC